MADIMSGRACRGGERDAVPPATVGWWGHAKVLLCGGGGGVGSAATE